MNPNDHVRGLLADFRLAEHLKTIDPSRYEVMLQDMASFMAKQLERLLEENIKLRTDLERKNGQQCTNPPANT